MDKELLLYNYFSNQLTEAQERLLNELLKTDTDFKTQFDFESDLKRVVKKRENENLKAKLIDFEKDVIKKALTTKSSGGFRKWSIAASIALVMGLGWLSFNALSEPDYDRLYDSNFQEYPNTVYAVTRGSEIDNSLEQRAFSAYDTNDNAEAIEFFNELKSTTNPTYVDYYLAQAYLKNGQHEKAIPLLESNIFNNREFIPESKWYLALAYLKRGKKEETSKILNDLIKDGRYKKEDAKVLLDSL